jgi:hypothetical protein
MCLCALLCVVCCFSVLFAVCTCTSILICGTSCLRSVGYLKTRTSIPLQPTRRVFHSTAIQPLSRVRISSFKVIIIIHLFTSHLGDIQIMFLGIGNFQMKQWFYVKNDLVEREDVKNVIQRPIQSCFTIRRPTIVNTEKAQACQVAFNIVCSYIGFRDLVQEHIAFKVWPLANKWEMPKETNTSSCEGGLVYLKYTYRYRDQFG